MNHLAHLALAGNNPHLLVGGFLGDYVKGRLQGQFPPEVERGIRLHRAIDAYTDRHPIVRQSRGRFQPRFRRYAGIMTDIIYDHLLAKTWRDFYPSPLAEFSRRALSRLLAHESLLPNRARKTAMRMAAHNALAGYHRDAFVAQSFRHLSARLTRDNPLAEAFDECQRHLPGLRLDLAAFYPMLEDFSEQWKRHHGSGYADDNPDPA